MGDDAALSCSLSATRKRNVQDESWFEIWRAALSVIIDVGAAERIFSSPSWSAVSQEASSLVSGSSVGKQLFSWAQLYCISDKLAKQAQSLVNAMVATKNVSSDLVKKWWQDVHTAADACDAFETLGGKRSIKVEYRGREVQVVVTSWQQQLEVMFGTALSWKNALAPKSLMALSLEEGLISHGPKDDVKAEQSILVSYANARQYANDMVQQQPRQG